MPTTGLQSHRRIRRLAEILAIALGLSVIPASFAQSNVRGGFGQVVQANIPHPNGNIYDQVLLTGPSVTVAADPGQVVRVSFLDDNDDITQVEFAGAGTATITLDAATYRPPAPPTKYHQPGITYVKGHATIHVQDAGPSTFISAFSVGRGNAVSSTLFPAGMTYDAMADLQLLRVEGAHLGGVLTGNVRYSGSLGGTGVFAPSTDIRSRVIVGEIAAEDDALPLLRIGAGSTLEWDSGAVLVAGGQLWQPNRTPIDVSSSNGAPLANIRSVDGTLSDGTLRPSRSLSAEFASGKTGMVSVDNVPRRTRGFIPVSFDDLLQEAGFSAFDFGEGVTMQLSGGNNGTYLVSENTVIEGEAVLIQLSGSYSYAVSGESQNRMTFSLTFANVSATSASASFRGTISELASLTGEVLPVRITAVAEFTSSVSGTATITLLYTNGMQETVQTDFDLDSGLDFRFL